MKFGIFYEHSVNRPWDAASEYRVYQQALEQVILHCLEADPARRPAVS